MHHTRYRGDLIAVWLPVSTALNSLSRSMGKEELYPFILVGHL